MVRWHRRDLISFSPARNPWSGGWLFMVKTGPRKDAEHGSNHPYPSLGVPEGSQWRLWCEEWRGTALFHGQKILVDQMSSGQWFGGVAAASAVLCSPPPVEGAFWEAVCGVAPMHWHRAPPFPLPWLSLAWGIATSCMCEPGKWVSSANWKSRLVTHFLHKEHIIFEPLFTMGSLSLEEKWDRGIVCVKAKQKKKKKQWEAVTTRCLKWEGKKGCYHWNVKWFPDVINHSLKWSFLI